MLPLPKRVEKTDVILTYKQGVWLPISVAYSGQLKADTFGSEEQYCKHESNAVTDCGFCIFCVKRHTILRTKECSIGDTLQAAFRTNHILKD